MARKTENHGKWKHPLGDEKIMKSLKKREKWEMHTEGPGIWRENWKSRKIEIHTLGREIYGEENWKKGGKFRNVHCRTWNMARKLKIMENENIHLTTKNNEITKKREKWEMHTEGPGIWRENWKSRRKWEIHTLGREIWWGKLKKVENLEMSTVGRGIWQENWKSWKIETSTWRRKIMRNH